MIDTHIHMIPGVDDGAKDMETAIQMLHVAINEGVNEMVLTPHFNFPIYHNQQVVEQYNLLKTYITKKKIDFKLHLGNEIYLSEEDLECIKTGQALCMSNTRYLLVELPFFDFYPFHEIMIQDLQKNGFKVILAHVERYQIFKKKPEKLQEFVKKGVFGQITSSYIMDKKTRKNAIKLIKSGVIHIAASDGHDIMRRPPVMKMAYDIISKVLGNQCAETLFVENPKRMIEDCRLRPVALEDQKKFRFPFK